MDDMSKKMLNSLCKVSKRIGRPNIGRIVPKKTYDNLEKLFELEIPDFCLPAGGAR